MTEFQMGLLVGAIIGFPAGFLTLGLMVMSRIEEHEGEDPDPERRYTR